MTSFTFPGIMKCTFFLLVQHGHFRVLTPAFIIPTVPLSCINRKALQG